MKVIFKDCGEVDDNKLAYAVIISRYKEKWIFVKHKERETWEIPGGRREYGEVILDTAKRELYEETGANQYIIRELSDYGVVTDEGTSYGRLYLAEVESLGKLPNLEIARVELFEDIPNELTYPYIQRELMKLSLA